MIYYEVSTAYLGTDEKGNTKVIKEKYLIDAVNFSDAEKEAFNILDCAENADVTGIKRVKAILFGELDNDNIYKIVVEFQDWDENMKLKKWKETFITANDLPEKAIKAYLNSEYSACTDSEVLSVQRYDVEDIVIPDDGDNEDDDV